jgi:5-methylcytosine-specific restriction enzyme A
MEQEKGNFPALCVGEEISNEDLASIFQCSPQGGMRRSLRTNSLVVISDHTKPDYVDTWKGNVLLYTGMGQIGNQKLDFQQNKTLEESNFNGVRVFLFEVFIPNRYRYQGQVRLAGEPYPGEQKDKSGINRKVWIFPIEAIDRKTAKEKLVVEAVSEESFEKEQLSNERQARKLTDSQLKDKLKQMAEKPEVQTIVSQRYERSAIIAELARRNAKGKCQLCNCIAPFLNKENVPFLEVHHIEWLSKGGTDAIDNTVALCPNCHRKMHVLDIERDKVILRGRIRLV